MLRTYAGYERLWEGRKLWGGIVNVAYPLLALDEIGDALKAPFSARTLNHLRLDQICLTIEDDLLAMLAALECRDPRPEPDQPR